MDKRARLIARGLEPSVAERAVAVGYGITRIKNATLGELAEQFGMDTAKLLKAASERKAIPAETVERLTQESHGICCLCRNWDDRKPTVIHHIVEHSITQDDSYDNLVLLCPTHHALAHTASSIARPPAPPELIRAAKREWIRAVADYLAGRRPKPGSEPLARRPSQATAVPPGSALIGRSEESHALFTTLRSHERVLLHGMGGVGKTALAVNAARHFQESGGEILWAGLSATNGSVSPIVDEWLARLGCNPSEEPTSAIRATLAGRVDSGQGFFVCIDGARPEWSDVVSLLLLAIPAHVYVLVTATHAGLAQTLDLTPIHLDTVPTETAVQLLTNRAGRDEQPLDRAIVEAVGGLPLALVLAGRQLAIRSRKVGGQDGILLMQIRQQLTVLDAPGHPGLAAIFRIAYEGLSEEEQRAFRAVSVFASSQCDLPAAAALTATDVNVVEQLLDRLSDANLLNWGRDGWYTQHALLKIFGRSCISPVEHDRVRERHLAHFVAMSTMLAPDSPRSDTLMIDYLPEAVVAAEYAAEHGRGEAIRHILLSYWIDAGVLARKKMLREAERLLVAARSYAAANDDGEALSVYTGHLASVYLLRGRIDDAERRYREAIEASRSLRLHSDESAHRGNLGMLLSQTGRYEEAAREHSAALDLAIQSGNVESAVNQINCLAILRRREGMLREAANLYQVGLSLIHDKTIDAVELRTLEGTLLSNLGLLYADMGELDTAEQLIGSGLDIARKVGDVHHEANRLGHLGNIKLARGDVDGASALLSSAVELAVEMEIPALEGSWRMNLGTVRVLQGAIEEARSHYTRALTLAEAIGFRELMGQASANLGRLHEQAGEWDSARESYELSLSAYGSAGGSAAVTVRQWLNDLNRRHPSALS